MDSLNSFRIIAGLIFIVFLGGNYWFARRFLSPRVARLYGVLVTIEFLLALADLFRDYFPPFWNWFFYLHGELNSESLFTSTQFVLAALTAAALGVWGAPSRFWHRLYWGLLAAASLYLACDEFFQLHEASQRALGLNQAKLLYALGGLILAGTTAAMAWFNRKDLKDFIVIFVSLGIIGGAGLGFESIIWPVMCQFLQPCFRNIVFGQTLEMFGTTLLLAGVLLQAEAHLSPQSLTNTQKLLWAGGALGLFYMVAYTWLLPTAELKLLAQRVNVSYAGGALTLLGYEPLPLTFNNEKFLKVTLYWQVRDPFIKDYNISAHLVSRPDLNSVAQADWNSNPELGVYPSIAWLPGLPVRTELYIKMPSTPLPAPSSYEVIVRAWTADGVTLPITQSEQPLLSADTVILQDVSNVQMAQVSAPPQSASYQLGDGLLLLGYTVPAQAMPGTDLHLQFWWRKERPHLTDPVQFVHLIGGNTNPATVYAHDQQPFNGSFPISDWPLNLNVSDEWILPLPADLPSGQYAVSTGLYEWPSLARLPVLDSSLESIDDNVIQLGTLQVP